MSICRIALSEVEKIDLVITKGMTANQVYSKYKPDYMINAALYDMATKENITNAKDEGKASGYLFSNEGIGITGNKILDWCEKSESVRDFIAGAPTLVKHGAKYINWGNKYSNYVDGNHKRSCIGFNGTHLFLVASDNNNTINSLAEYCIRQQMKYAINLDGGGSCHLQEGSKKLKSSGRANCSWILVFLKKEIKEEEKVKSVKVKCNGKEQEGFIKDGVTYVPVRFVGENLDANVAWDGTTKTVTVTQRGSESGV